MTYQKWLILLMCRDSFPKGFSIHHYGRHRSGMAATDRPSVENYRIGCGL
jgi:hypothetical protein